MEDPKTTKGLVKRDIVRMADTGYGDEASMLDERRNDFLCCLFTEGAPAAYALPIFPRVKCTQRRQQVLMLSEVGDVFCPATLLGGDAVTTLR